MRAAGIREIKNRLSEYLRLVAEGETVLVTDRGRVVAQLAPPPVAAAPAVTETEALRRLAAAGKVRLPSGTVPSPGAGAVPGVPGGLEPGALLDEVRSGREEEGAAGKG
jgi:prevent-host-death family protein